MFAIGGPIRTGSGPGSTGDVADQTVVSVGPYMFHTDAGPGEQLVGQVARQRLAAAEDLDVGLVGSHDTFNRAVA